MKLIKTLTLSALYLFFLASAVAEEKKTLIIGKVAASDKEKNFPQMKAMIDYVSNQMADVGIENGEVFMQKIVAK
jgi:hypothetical protein